MALAIGVVYDLLAPFSPWLNVTNLVGKDNHKRQAGLVIWRAVDFRNSMCIDVYSCLCSILELYRSHVKAWR